MRGTFFQLFCLILWLNAFSDGFGATPVSPTDKKLSPEKTSNCVEGDLLPRSTKSERITEAEDKFCAEIRQNPDLQAIYGFVITPRIAQIVRVYKDKAVFTYYEDNVRFKERTLSRTETAALQKRIAEDKPEQQAPLRDLCAASICVSVMNFSALIKTAGGASILSRRAIVRPRLWMRWQICLRILSRRAILKRAITSKTKIKIFGFCLPTTSGTRRRSGKTATICAFWLTMRRNGMKI